MNKRLASVPAFLGSFWRSFWRSFLRSFLPSLLLSFLLLVPACDPEYNLCVVATSCMNDQPIAGAHVRIQAYELDGSTDSAGKICKQELNFPDPFEIEVDAPGYIAKTDGPFQFEKPGRTNFQATVCLDPQP